MVERSSEALKIIASSSRNWTGKKVGSRALAQTLFQTYRARGGAPRGGGVLVLELGAGEWAISAGAAAGGGSQRREPSGAGRDVRAPDDVRSRGQLVPHLRERILAPGSVHRRSIALAPSQRLDAGGCAGEVQRFARQGLWLELDTVRRW